jgi:predicted Fe-Mo cluster-binding NifX family protein
MKMAITAAGLDLASRLDPRFGRAARFLIVDADTLAVTAHDNAQNLNAEQGAGIQSAETVARLGASVVITGHVGPKAFRALKAAGIRIFLSAADSAEEALRLFRAGELKEAQSETNEGHVL